MARWGGGTPMQKRHNLHYCRKLSSSQHPPGKDRGYEFRKRGSIPRHQVVWFPLSNLCNWKELILFKVRGAPQRVGAYSEEKLCCKIML